VTIDINKVFVDRLTETKQTHPL